MNAESYVNHIVRKIKCSRKKKKAIKKELMTEIKMRQEQGEALENILSEMGDIKEIADSFNESMSHNEQQTYRRQKAAVIAAAAVLTVLAVVTACLYTIPRSADIEYSKYFDKQTLKEKAKETIMLFDDENYDALQENAIEEMQGYLNKETLQAAKAQLSGEWGERKSFGKSYISEMTKGRKHFAVIQTTVNYENVSAVYTLTYDNDMKLAGLYIK